MRNQWYGDKRDYMKWTSLLTLANRERIGRIFQVAMQTDPGPQPVAIHSSAQPLVNQQYFAQRVAGFFHGHNDLGRIAGLDVQRGIVIEVYLRRFEHRTRGAHFVGVLERIRAPGPGTLWFFDPDTGIEPDSGATVKHVKQEELQQAFEEIPSGHLLACYQHRWFDNDWHNIARNRFGRALGVDAGLVEIFTSDDANDVIILAAQKP